MEYSMVRCLDVNPPCPNTALAYAQEEYQPTYHSSSGKTLMQATT